ncbi:MAG: hypothetical protein KGL74_01890, partial [Elusimicrobia bacterium]|nr:hypothetical protein [Elusimicrobiota bacterium]
MKHKGLKIAGAVAVLAVGGYEMRVLISRKNSGGPENAAAKRICILHKCTMSHCVMELTAMPGKKAVCPICGEVEVTPDAKGRILYYRNSMQPEVTSPVPMKDGMGMDYVPVYAEEGAASDVPGQGSLVLSEEKRQMIGMKSAEVEPRDLAVAVRASGRVAYDPGLYNAIAEYGEAAKARDSVKESSYPDVHQRADALVR